MQMMVFYNEIDPFAAEWLRQMIRGGHIADGIVDERSIVEIDPDELKQYTQCHFFAGIGGWSYALRLAGVPDDFPVWTGSCPCQPFSSAGKQRAADDERHLWPAFFRLIRECRPGIVFGEQVAGHAGYAWWDAVATDLESEGYAVAAADIGAHSIGAPHIRQRLYWVADAQRGTAERHRHPVGAAPRGSEGEIRSRSQRVRDDVKDGFNAGDVAHSNNAGLEGRVAVRQRADQCAAGPDVVASGLADAEGAGPPYGRFGSVQPVTSESSGVVGGLADATSVGREVALQHTGSVGSPDAERQADVARGDGASSRPSPTNGHWQDADWLFCRDGKWRPVEPGAFPLAYGVSARVGRLRGYGNAIVPQVAACFVETVMEGA